MQKVFKEYVVRVSPAGDQRWYLNGKLHREDGPAIEYTDGERHWFINDERHREDGPAIEWANGTKDWWLNGICYPNETEWREALNEKKKNNTCDGKIVEIEGVKYRLAIVE